MRTLLIACGNPLRGDDGVALAALDLIPAAPGLVTLSVQQLAPELAEEIAGFERVVFLDADARASSLAIEPAPEGLTASPLTHSSDPAEVVALSRALFGFAGEALVCRIPVRDFSPGAPLTAAGTRRASEAAGELQRILSETMALTTT
jgi:hydrogenase maturation protease